MKKVYIKYATAQLAKEKDFNLPLDNNNWYFSKEGVIHNYNWFRPEELTDYIDAVTQSVIQKWLREMFRIMVIVDFYDDSDDYTPNYEVKVSYPKTWDKCDEFVKSGFETYEGALEIGLLKGLNLIK